MSHVMRASLAVVAAAAAARLAGVSSVRDVISDSVVGGWLRLMLYTMSLSGLLLPARASTAAR